MSQISITTLILIIMVAFLLYNRIPAYITALCTALALAFLGILPMKFLFTGFANPILILFAGMFVIGDSLFQTGLASTIGEWTVKRAGHSERLLLWGTMIIASVLSTFASNTGTTAALMPVVMGICTAAKIPISRQLMPMAFASGFGGFSALIGTPPNIIISNTLSANGFRAFGFFEFAWVGIPLAIAGMAYMDWARHWLPNTLSTTIIEKRDEQLIKTHSALRMWLSAIILLLVILFMIFGPSSISLEAIAVAGAVLCVLTGCISAKKAIHSIEWETVILFASMFAVAHAMETSGVASKIANGLLHIIGSQPNTYFVIAVPLLFTMLLGAIISNTASAVLMAPIGISMAKLLGANPHAILMAIAVAASCSFLTPLGTPPNMLVWKPGNYKFSDYLKVGVGLSLVCLLVGMIVIPLKWPVFP